MPTEVRAEPDTDLDLEEAVIRALDARIDPVMFRGRRVCVAVPDHTRPIAYEQVVEPLVLRLREARAAVDIVVALGLHRPLDRRELEPLRGIAARHGARLWQHDARSEDLITLIDDVGLVPAASRDGLPALPAQFHPAVAMADLVLCVGVVEPHQYAGFSGGIKTVSIGCAGARTISAMHGMTYLRDPHTCLSNVDDNPFQAALWRLGASLNETWALQILPARPGRCHGVWFGPARGAFHQALEVARQTFFTTYAEPVDWMHLRVPPTKAVNFYQASRAATYVALVDRPAIREGGTLLIEAPCPEGIGQGPGELACADAMRRGKDRLLAELRADGPVELQGGEQRAYVVARALERCRIALVGAVLPMPELDAMGILRFDNLFAARTALELDGEGLTVDNVFHNVPILAPS